MRRDLAVIAGLALVELLLVIVAAPVAVRTPFVLPLVLILPGYAVAARLFPPGAAGVAERGVYTVAFSLAISAIGAVILQLVLNLDRIIFAIFLSAVTIVVALVRTPRRAPGRVRLTLPRALPVAIAFFAAATAISLLAITSASDGLGHADSKVRFTDLWMLPTGESAVGADRVLIGVESHEKQPTDYRLVLLRGGRTVTSMPLDLDSGQTWERAFAVAPNGETLRAALLRGAEEYRHVDLVTAP